MILSRSEFVHDVNAPCNSLMVISLTVCSGVRYYYAQCSEPVSGLLSNLASDLEI